MALVTAEVSWLRWLLEDFGVSVSGPSPLLSDCTGAISIGVDASYTRDDVIAVQYVPSELQLADFFMKARTRVQHNSYLSKLSV